MRFKLDQWMKKQKDQVNFITPYPITERPKKLLLIRNFNFIYFRHIGVNLNNPIF